MTDSVLHHIALIDLAARLERLAVINPEAHSRVLRLIDRFVNTPDMSDDEIGREVSRAMGIPPGVVN